MIGRTALAAWATAGDTGLTLPGAADLADFAALWGGDTEAAPEAGEEGPVLLPGRVTPPVVLTRPVHLPLYADRHVYLQLPPIPCAFTLQLGDRTVLTDGDVPEWTDLTLALDGCRDAVLTLSLEGAEPFFLDAPQLHVCRGARLLSCPSRRQGREVRLSPEILALQPIEGFCRARLLSGGSLISETLFPVRLEKGQEAAYPFSMRGEGPDLSLTLELFMGTMDRPGPLQSRLVLPVFEQAQGTECYYPLSPEESRQSDVLEHVRLLNLPGIYLPAGIRDRDAFLLNRAHLRLFFPAPGPRSPLVSSLPHTLLEMPAPAFPDALGAAYQLMQLTAAAPSVPEVPEDVLFRELCGFCPAPGTAEAVLSELEKLYLCLRAESARQGRARGPLCAPGTLSNPDMCQLLASIFAPVHLSLCPMRGAFYAGARFSCSVHLFAQAPCAGEISLWDGENLVHAEEFESAPGPMAPFTCTLPDHACRLILSFTLWQGDEVCDSGDLPIFCGPDFPLQAAFSGLAAYPLLPAGTN